MAKVHILHRKKPMCGTTATDIRTVHFKYVGELFNHDQVCSRCNKIFLARKKNPGAG